MKFVCDRCHTKYSIADEKVRGKILKVRCKSCSNVITVREAPAAAPAQPEPVEFEESARTVIVPSVPDHVAAVARATAAGNRPSGAMRAVGAAPPPPPAPADDVQWFLALEGVQKGPFSRKGLIDKLVAMPRDADVHVWNEKLDGWKPPKDVAVIERDLQARRRQTVAPPPPPGMRPRVPTGPQPLAAAPVRRTGSHALPGPHGSATSAPAAAATGHAPGIGTAEHPPRTRRPTNGLAAHSGGAPTAPLTGESDALNALNLKQGAGSATSHQGHGQHGHEHAPVPALDMGQGALSDVAGSAAPWQATAVPAISTSPSTSMAVVPRQRSAKLIIGFLGIVSVIVIVVTYGFIKKPPAPIPEKPRAAAEEGFAAMAAKVQQEQKQAAEPAPAVAAPVVAPPTESPGKSPTVATIKPTKQNKRAIARARAAAARGGRSAAGAAGGAGTDTAADPTASRFADSSGRSINVQGGGGGGARSTPSQSDISRVISNNKAGIKICYQRALLRDSSLTHGKIAVRVSIGLSGRAKSVHVDGPTPFRALEPCIREVLSRWAFPASSEEYGTEFSYVFQGNE